LRGKKTGERSTARKDQGLAFLEGPERRNQNPLGGASRSRSPQSRQRAGVFAARLAREKRWLKRKMGQREIKARQQKKSKRRCQSAHPEEILEGNVAVIIDICIKNATI
jgi:hypothetical protein